MSERIQKIKDTYSSQFKDRLKQEKVSISPDSAWDILVSADLVRNQKNVRWLVETYINKGYLWEDIMSGPTSKVAETLTEFDKHKKNLEVKDRSLTRYQTLGALWASIKPYVGQLTPGEEKKSERDKAYAEAEVVIDREDGLKIIVPLTEYSAKWFGRGTRWCTSAENNNMFEEYTKDAPLFIIFMPDGNKLQLWKDCDNIQFMDENDNDISINYIKENWDILEPVCRWTKQLKYVPEQLLDREMCLEAVKQDGWIIEDVPMKYRDYDICMEAVKQDGWALHSVPKKYKDYDMCLEAVKNYGLALSHVPKNILDKDMYLEAIRQNGDSLEYVPEELIDEKMRLVASKNKETFTDNIPDRNMDTHRKEIDRMKETFNNSHIPSPKI